MIVIYIVSKLKLVLFFFIKCNNVTYSLLIIIINWSVFNVICFRKIKLFNLSLAVDFKILLQKTLIYSVFESTN